MGVAPRNASAGQQRRYHAGVSDIQTLQNVDIPVAMANSTSDLLSLGFNQTKSNDENGVAAFLQDLLLKR